MGRIFSSHLKKNVGSFRNLKDFPQLPENMVVCIVIYYNRDGNVISLSSYLGIKVLISNSEIQFLLLINYSTL